jgi:beta-N-acetylhexosaminidase
VFIRHIDPDHPATLSAKITTGLLREALGFTGVVLSDDMNMGAIAKYYSPAEALERAINAGIDIIVHGNCLDYDEHIIEHTLEHLHRLIEQGRLSAERIDASFQRILALKRRVGLVPERFAAE